MYLTFNCRALTMIISKVLCWFERVFSFVYFIFIMASDNTQNNKSLTIDLVAWNEIENFSISN